MVQILRKYSKPLLIFSTFTFLLLLLWQQFMPLRFQNPWLWLIWLFFMLSTAAIHLVLLDSLVKEPRRFIGYYMGITALKLFGYLIVLVAYALLNPAQALGFILWFLCLYLLYSGFEVVMLMKELRKK